jgi:hypothetical protein
MEKTVTLLLGDCCLGHCTLPRIRTCQPSANTYGRILSHGHSDFWLEHSIDMKSFLTEYTLALHSYLS